MAFNDKLAQALTAGTVKFGIVKESTPKIKTSSTFAGPVPSDKGLADSLIAGTVFAKLNEEVK